MTADPIKDAAQELAASAEPPGPQQEAAIAQLGPHMDTQNDAAANDAA